MNRLTELQNNFVRSLYYPKDENITEAIHKSGISPEARLGIYRNNVISNLTNSLRNIYPVIEKLGGEEFFSFLSVGYITARPSSSGNLDAYGEDFKEFLKTFAPAAELPYLPDVAALEWAVHTAYHAADHAPINAEALAQVPSEDYGNLHFTCAPSMTLLSSPHPLLRIWEVNQPAYNGAMQVDFTTNTHHFVIHREQSFAITIRPLTKALFHFLTHLARGDNLYQSYEATEATDPDFDLAAAISTCATQDILVDFAVKNN